MGVVVDNSVEEIGSYELGDNFGKHLHDMSNKYTLTEDLTDARLCLWLMLSRSFSSVYQQIW